MPIKKVHQFVYLAQLVLMQIQWVVAAVVAVKLEHFQNQVQQEGTFSEVKATVCTPCPGGSYSDHDGSSSCLKCPKGTYSYVGYSQYVDCPEGTFSDIGTHCIPCQAGEYSNK